MTIAACHLSREGVVLGADSATTLSGPHVGTCHLDHAQKLFEVGPPGSTIGLVTWGQGFIGAESHRTIAATIGHEHLKAPFGSVQDMAEKLAKDLWSRFAAAYSAEIAEAQNLMAKFATSTNTPEELEKLENLLQRCTGGYCLAGRVEPFGQCHAYEILWGPLQTKCNFRELQGESPIFWGVPQIMQRLLYGFDNALMADILASGKWSGNEKDLIDIVAKHQLISPRLLPIREAIDWVHTVIHTTIRGTKFANWPHWCGGPVEIAAITTDRQFRWVRHKELDSAIITAEES